MARPLRIEYADGRIVNWEWNFGDGNRSRGEMATHAYEKEGIFLVTLKVTDNDDCSESCMNSVIISK
jgi:PKD repeat protein